MGLNQVTLIEELVMKREPEDDNLIIVEDVEDTKKTTIREFKKNMSGDYRDPSEWKFYSSKFVEQLLDSMKKDMSIYAYSSDVLYLKNRIESIIATAGSGQNTEVVDARDGKNTLQARLERDLGFAEDKYLKKLRRKMEGKKVSTGMEGYVDVTTFDLPAGKTANIVITSKNLLNMSPSGGLPANQGQIASNSRSTGFVYTQKNNNYMEFEIPIGQTLSAGTYVFYANVIFGSGFTDRNEIILAVKNTRDDSAYKEFSYRQVPEFVFTSSKAFDTIKFKFNRINFVTNASVEYSNMMITREKTDKYINYYVNRSNVISGNGQMVQFYNRDYDIQCVESTTSANINLVLQYWDQKIDFQYIYDRLQKVTDITLDNIDHCGLIQKRGEYLFFTNDTILSIDRNVNKSNDITKLEGNYPKLVRFSYDDDKHMRNNIPSLKITFNSDINGVPSIITRMPNTVYDIDSVSIVMYIDSTVSQYMVGRPQFQINMCSDSYDEPNMVNYFSAGIELNKLVQGWNIIKIPFDEFVSHGNPNEHGIKYIEFLIDKNSNMDDKSIYLNSFVFNQEMKPTVLLAFDGIYEEGITYTYPYLAAREFPATILANSRQTFSNNILASVLNLRTSYDWDLGQYGAHPRKETLVEDNNSRDQYLLLKSTKEWLQNNLVNTPISYSAPFGNLRPITVPLLRDLGFKIAKVKSTGYCNFFDPRYDFAIPMHLMSNEVTLDEIKSKIQYAIDHQCCICIYTNNVTEYGDEQSVKKAVFEEVIKFISDNSDKITAMTMAEFYKKCVK